MKVAKTGRRMDGWKKGCQGRGRRKVAIGMKRKRKEEFKKRKRKEKHASECIHAKIASL